MSIVAEKITKSFAGRRVLDNVDLTVGRGELHALLGANGSGKSTLVKILTGVYSADGGRIEITGRSFQSIASPGLANDLGIAAVHQEAPLSDTATIAESIALFRGYPTRMGRVLWGKLHRDVAATLERFSLHIDPRRLVGSLSAAERASVALIVALDRVGAGVNLLVLDEVTASLPRDEATPYLDRVTALAATGVSILMVTHRLGELHGRASRMTILRDGKKVFSGAIGETDDETIVNLMVGRSGERSTGAGKAAAAPRPRRATPPARPDIAAPALEIEHLKTNRLDGISLKVHPHEIVGVAGLADTGIDELPQVLSGSMPYWAGRISVNGSSLSPYGGPGASIRAGLAVLPADRLRSGGIATMSVGENIMLPDIGRYFLRGRQERSAVEQVITAFDIRPPRADAMFGRLSGGNQQKALLGKWLHLRPAVLVLDDPTHGVDPGARETIFAMLRGSVQEGLGVLLFSTEPEQLADLCSRVLVLKAGRIATELTGASLTHTTISQWCYK